MLTRGGDTVTLFVSLSPPVSRARLRRDSHCLAGGDTTSLARGSAPIRCATKEERRKEGRKEEERKEGRIVVDDDPPLPLPPSSCTGKRVEDRRDETRRKRETAALRGWGSCAATDILVSVRFVRPCGRRRRSPPLPPPSVFSAPRRGLPTPLPPPPLSYHHRLPATDPPGTTVVRV